MPAPVLRQSSRLRKDSAYVITETNAVYLLTNIILEFCKSPGNTSNTNHILKYSLSLNTTL